MIYTIIKIIVTIGILYFVFDTLMWLFSGTVQKITDLFLPILFLILALITIWI